MSELLSARTAAERADRLNRFAAEWTGLPLVVEPAWPELPIALRTLYGFRSLAPRLLAQDTLVDPPEVSGDRATFVIENQAVWRAWTLVGPEDPPVWREDEADPVCARVSDFLVAFVLQELVFGSDAVFADEAIDHAMAQGEPPRLLWEGRYAWPWTVRFQTWRGTLVMGTERTSFVAANRPEVVAMLDTLQSPITRLTLFLSMSWSLDLDASGTCTVRRDGESLRCDGRVRFVDALAEALSVDGGPGSLRDGPIVVFGRRGGRLSRSGDAVSDPDWVRGMFRRALADHPWARDL